MEYLAVHLGKRQLSKRSRLPLPLPSEGREGDENGPGRVPYLAPDAQYEVIQQDGYPYCEEGPKGDKVTDSNSDSEHAPDKENRKFSVLHYQMEKVAETSCSSEDRAGQSSEQKSDDNSLPVNV